MITILRQSRLAILALLPTQAAVPWPDVKAADFKNIPLDEFSDHELEVPEMLFHFQQIANALNEKSRDRGVLDLAVNRDPRDNKRYNVCIKEMEIALAYFYTTGRAWNPYRKDPALRLRLEAMLDCGTPVYLKHWQDKVPIESLVMGRSAYDPHAAVTGQLAELRAALANPE